MRLGFAALTLLAGAYAATAEPRQNMTDAIAGIEAVRGINVSPVVGSDVCFSDAACQATAGNVDLQTRGGMLLVGVSDSDTAEDYLKTCAGALSGLSGVGASDAKRYIAQAFDEAAAAGEFEADISGTEITVRPGRDSRLTCEFFRR